MGLESQITSEQVQRMGAALAQTSTFTDEASNAAARYFLEIEGFDTSKLDDILQASADLAAGTGQSLETSAAAIAQALLTGQTRSLHFSAALREQVTTMVKAGDQAGALALIMDELNKRYGGQAAAQLETYSGKVDHLKNSWGELLETSGETPIQSGKGVVETTDDAIMSLTKLLSMTRQYKGIDVSTMAANELLGINYDPKKIRAVEELRKLRSQQVGATYNYDYMKAEAQSTYNLSQGIDSATQSYMAMAKAGEDANQVVIDGTAATIDYSAALAYGLDYTQQANDLERQRVEIQNEINAALVQGYTDSGRAGTRIYELKAALSELNDKGREARDQALFQFLAEGLNATNPQVLWSAAYGMGMIDEKSLTAYVNAKRLSDVLNQLPANTSVDVIMRIIQTFTTNAVTAPPGFHYDDNGELVPNGAWAGGNFAPGWVITGDAPGGGFTPYTEAIYAPGGAMVLNAAQTRARFGGGGTRGYADGGMVPPSVTGATQAAFDESIMREFSRMIVDELRKTSG